MSNPIEESARYYGLLAAKHQASGRGPNQSRVYGELVPLVQQCSSLEEIQERMKSGGYYESPAQALALDKLLAHRDAAATLGFTALAAIYQRRHDQVAANYQAAWDTSWANESSGELNRIGGVVDAFNEMMSAYFLFRSACDFAQDEPLAKLRAAVTAMQSKGETFESVTQSAYYRAHSMLAEKPYQAAITAIANLLGSTPDSSAAQAQLQERMRILLESANTEELVKLEKEHSAAQRRAVNLCVAPDDAPGEYHYELFFEGKL